MWVAISGERTGLSFTVAAGFASVDIPWSESRGTLGQILLSQVRHCLNLEIQVHVFISPGTKVTRLYPQALGSLFVASYDSQRYDGGILTRFSGGCPTFPVGLRSIASARKPSTVPVLLRVHSLLWKRVYRAVA
jgi:hypothetical protein